MTKLVAVYLLANFECRVEDTRGMNFEWRDALVPNAKTVLLMQARQKE